MFQKLVDMLVMQIAGDIPALTTSSVDEAIPLNVVGR